MFGTRASIYSRQAYINIPDPMDGGLGVLARVESCGTMGLRLMVLRHVSWSESQNPS